MAKSKSIGREIIEGFEELAIALESGEQISDRFKCHKTVLDLTPNKYDGKCVKRTRGQLNVSQAVMAKSVKTIRAWEQDVNPVPGVARRLFDEIEHNPAYFRDRIKELAVKRSRQRSRAR